ncbi:MAG TPA: hypothetical protein VFB04_11150 [Terriglobales bacterium]|nr:hypothetical protein [Terriglobales bacterium]
MNIVESIAVGLFMGFATITYVPTIAAQPKCKGNSEVMAACYTVHGRLQLGADTVRLWLWPVGTKRYLGVTGGPVLDDAVAPIYPQNIKFDSNTEAIFGDFEVCPFTPERKGAMRLVCIESASHLVVKHWPKSASQKHEN